jgi:flagellar biosynthesis protein FlhG
MLGQAERLFELSSLSKSVDYQKDDPQIIAVTSGKGGTGKSFIAANLAFSLAVNGCKVLLVDMDINLSNQKVLFNVSPKKTIYHYLLYNQDLSDLIHKTDSNPNLSIIFGESGKLDHPTLSDSKVKILISEIRNSDKDFDIVIIDTSSGIEKGTLQLLLNSDEILLITTPEPTSVMDGYVINKLLKNNGSNASVRVVVNKCFNQEEASEAFENLANATKHFLQKEISFLGDISFSEDVIRSIQSQSLIMKNTKNSKIQAQISKISAKLKIPAIG